MRLGLIARADRGGLASISLEVWRHLQPERVLLVDLGLAARGGFTDLHAYDATWCRVSVTKYHRSGFEIERFLQGLEVVWAAETVYEDHVFPLARASRCATALYVMPELFWPAAREANALWVPTDWERGRLPSRTELVPMPIALDRFTYRHRQRLETLFVTTGEAMEDRNGWDAVQAALPMIDRPLRLLWRGGMEGDPTPRQVGKVTVEWVPPVADYWEVVPPEADLLLLPRKYGGLCLPQAEAAAQGVPTVMTDLAPQNGWIAPDLLVGTQRRPREAVMKGGKFAVYDANPADIAAVVNRLAADPDRMEKASIDVREWAEQHAWDVLKPDWQHRLERLARR